MTRGQHGAFTFGTLLMLLCGACAGEDTSPRPPAPPRHEVLSVADVPGCYEITSMKWAPDFRSETERQGFALPRFFRLKAELSLYRGRIIPRESTTITMGGNWNLTGDTDLTMTWGNLSRVVRVTLRKRLTDAYFYGRAEPFAEGPGATPPSRGSVMVAKVQCWPEPEIKLPYL